jgi:DNA repair exonuclease SbcCD nuclease subunit
VKICLLGDTHLGIRNDSKTFHLYFEKFFKNIFFPYLEKNNITKLIQVGDLFDRRKFINYYTLYESRRYFFDRLNYLGIDLHVILGNHDIFWRENLTINSPSLLLENYSNIEVYSEPTTKIFDNLPIDIIPWICKDNEKQIINFIDSSKTNICIGHFEINGFEMMKGVECHEGIDKALLKRYKQVYSGHFHTSSHKNNILYLGTPYELTWSDYGDIKGFYILDTKTEQIEFIKNPYNMFTKIYYDETKDYSDLNTQDKYIKLIVVNKTNQQNFDKFVDNLYKSNPSELKIIEDLTEFESSTLDDNLNLEDTMTLLSEYVDGLETNADRLRIKNILKELYIEAHDYEET